MLFFLSNLTRPWFLFEYPADLSSVADTGTGDNADTSAIVDTGAIVDTSVITDTGATTNTGVVNSEFVSESYQPSSKDVEDIKRDVSSITQGEGNNAVFLMPSVWLAKVGCRIYILLITR